MAGDGSDGKGEEVLKPQTLNQVLERAKAEWEAAFDSITEGIAIVDPDGTVRRVNRALAGLVGRDVRVVVGLSCCDLFSHHRADRGACPIRNYPRGNTGVYEVFFPEYRYYEERIHPIIRGGKTLGYVITVREITRERLAAQEKKHLHLQIEEAAKRRKHAEEIIQAVRAELLRAEETAVLGRLAAIVFGEIYRSVRMIEEGLGILRDGTRRPEEAAAVVNDLALAAHRSRKVLDSLSRLRIEESDAVPALDLNVLVQEVVQDLAPLAERKQAVLVLNAGKMPPFEGSPGRMKAVVSSVVLNALEATRPQGGKVTIRTGVERGHLCIEVTDQGEGIRPAHLPQIFNPFFTTDALGDKVGMGLTICQAIVQGHQGHIEVASEPDQGTRVKILLPAAEAEVPAPSPPAA